MINHQPQALEHGRRQARTRRVPRRHKLRLGPGAGEFQGYKIPLHQRVLIKTFIIQPAVRYLRDG